MEVSFGKCMGKMQSCLFSQLVWSGLMRKFLKAIKLRHQFVVMLKYNFYYPGDKSSMWFGEIGTFWAKKITQEKSTKFIKIFELYQIFIHNFLSQNVPINPNHIPSPHTKSIFYLFYQFSSLSVKIGSISFLSSSDMHQSHHLAGCHSADISFLLISFLHVLRCVYSSYNAWFKSSCG